jgi:hypothetical protein
MVTRGTLSPKANDILRSRRCMPFMAWGGLMVLLLL